MTEIDKKWYKLVDIYEVVPDERNSKDHDIGTLCQSMQRFGYTQPILVNTKDKKILAGHGRVLGLQTLKEQGYEAPKRILEDADKWFVPCYFIDIDNKDEAEAYLIADNRLTELGGWIDDKLINSLEHILKQTGTLDGTGWDLEDVDDLIQDLEEPINVDDEEIAVKVGKYKLKVSKQSYDEWLIQVQKQVGKEKDDILDWIAEQLHIGRL